MGEGTLASFLKSDRRPNSPLKFVPHQYRRYVRPAALVSIVVLILWIFTRNNAPQAPWGDVSQFSSLASSSHPSPNSAESHEFLDLFSYALAKGKPSFDIRIAKDEDGKELDAGWHMWDPITKDDRPDILDITPMERMELSQNHKAAVLDFGKLSPRVPFAHGTRGIAMTAGNDAYPILATSLRLLRMVGSTLPVEILVGSYADYERVPCEEIFPKFNAKCIVLTDFLPEHMSHPLEVKSKFEFKTLSILFSSFEQVLFLDCDLFPVMNPDPVFVTEPFLSNGFILWPDHWASTSSRHYFEMLERPTPNMTIRASTESGALIINKRTHAAALLLSSFYNHWGDKFYYMLFSQGATGMGDKDTFIPAIEAFGLPFYQVHEAPQRLGYRCGNRRQNVASGQAHPHDDWMISSNGIYRDLEENEFITDAPDPRILFVHANLPKLDFPLILEWSEPAIGWLDMLRCDDNKGQVHRMWGPKELTMLKFGWDVEKAAWDAMRYFACNHEYAFRIWVNGSWHSQPKENVCSRSLAFYKELLPNEKYEEQIKPLPHGAIQFGFQALT